MRIVIFASPSTCLRASGAAFAIALTLMAPPTNAMSLPEALALAYTNNPQLASERAQLRTADEGVAQAVSNLRPSVQVSASDSFTKDMVSGGTALQNQFYSGQTPHDSYGVSVSEALYRGGRTTAQINQALDTVHAEYWHLMSIEQQVLLAAMTDYADVLRDQAILELDLRDEQALLGRLTATKARLAGGEAGRIDVSDTEAAYRQAVAERSLAEAKIAGSRYNFQRDVGVFPTRLAYPRTTLSLPLNISDAETMAANSNPDVLSALFVEKASEQNIQQALGQTRNGRIISRSCFDSPWRSIPEDLSNPRPVQLAKRPTPGTFKPI